MPEHISNPGVGFYLCELKGSLKYSLFRQGKAPISGKIQDEISDDSAAVRVKNEIGIAASAVGCQLHLMKNDGLLKIEFQGLDNSTAEWSFEGLATSDGRSIMATAGTQTCLSANPRQSNGTQTSGTQTSSIEALFLHQHLAAQLLRPFIETAAVQSLVKIMTRNVCRQFTKAKGILERDPKTQTSFEALQARLREQDSHANMVNAKGAFTGRAEPSVGTSKTNSTKVIESADCQAPVATKSNALTSLKRKASSLPAARPPLHKHAKSRHDAPAWPRHLYMTCLRTSPNFKGDIGNLHIDVEEAMVWYEGWYGRTHHRTWESKQVPHKDAGTKVIYQLIQPQPAPCSNSSTHTLRITHKKSNSTGEQPLFEARCAKPGWEIWGSNEPDGTKIPLRSARVIIDAIVHCIDRTSGRAAVHDPAIMHKLKEDITSCEKRIGMRLKPTTERCKALAARKKVITAVLLCDLEDDDEEVEKA